jgi:hypothetical protein
MIEAEIVLGALEAFLDRPAQAGDAGKIGERDARRREDQMIPKAPSSDSRGIPFPARC